MQLKHPEIDLLGQTVIQSLGELVKLPDPLTELLESVALLVEVALDLGSAVFQARANLDNTRFAPGLLALQYCFDTGRIFGESLKRTGALVIIFKHESICHNSSEYLGSNLVISTFNQPSTPLITPTQMKCKTYTRTISNNVIVKL